MQGEIWERACATAAPLVAVETPRRFNALLSLPFSLSLSPPFAHCPPWLHCCCTLIAVQWVLINSLRLELVNLFPRIRLRQTIIYQSLAPWQSLLKAED